MTTCFVLENSFRNFVHFVWWCFVVVVVLGEIPSPKTAHTTRNKRCYSLHSTNVYNVIFLVELFLVIVVRASYCTFIDCYYCCCPWSLHYHHLKWAFWLRWLGCENQWIAWEASVPRLEKRTVGYWADSWRHSTPAKNDILSGPADQFVSIGQLRGRSDVAVFVREISLNFQWVSSNHRD